MEVDDEYVPAYTTMAILMDLKGDPVEAQSYYLEALDIDHRNPELLNNYGTFLCKNEKVEEALEQFEKIREFSPKNRQSARYIPWIKEVIKAENNPVAIPARKLEKYAGDYGPRHIKLRDGHLYYQRDEGKERELLPLSEDLFTFKGNGIFRLKFVADEDGNITKAVGIYIEGHSDESLRGQ